ncbi:MAG: TRAP transporter substrate-binding protein [Pseudolabrys sp.]
MAASRLRLFGAIATSILGIAFAAPATAQTPDVTWKFAHENRETVPAAKAAHILADAVAKKTGGHFKIQIYPAGQLGKEAQLIEQLQLGTVQMAFTPTAPLSNFEPRLQLIDLPFLFPSREAAYTVLDGPVGQELLAGLGKRGIKGLAFWESGFKQMTSSVKPILAPGDLSGQKVRTMQSPMLLEQYREWGANPVAISFSETYNALQQGVADAQENPLVSIDSMRFYEVQKFLTLSNHGYTAFAVMANRKAYDGLPAEYRKALDEAVVEARDAERKDSKQVDDELLKKIAEHMKILDLPAEGRQAFVKVSRELHKKYEGKVTKALLEKTYEQTKPFEK